MAIRLILWHNGNKLLKLQANNLLYPNQIPDWFFGAVCTSDALRHKRKTGRRASLTAYRRRSSVRDGKYYQHVNKQIIFFLTRKSNKDIAMKRSALMLVLFSIITFSSCHRADQSAVNIIPKPAKIKVYNGTFNVSDSTRILVESGNGRAVYIGQYLAQRIEKASGYKLSISSTKKDKMIVGAILLTTAGADEGLGDEGYVLESNKNGVIIRGRPAGLFYGVQTLFQLLPPQIFKTDSAQTKIAWTIPAVKIKDKPRFPWRGMHLDVSRHFFSVVFIKIYIDELSMHKMIIFHWHLTDDQGWRI